MTHPVKTWITLGLCLLTACGGGTSDPNSLERPDMGGVPDLCSLQAPCALTLDEASSEVIAPVGDVDSFTFSASDGDIVSVVVENRVTRSPVSLRASLFGPSGESVAFGQNMGSPSQIQRFVIQHVARATGTFRVDVRDVGDDDQDDDGPFSVTVSILPQEDPFEPNDSIAEALPVTLPTTLEGGRIASDGDEDWFSFELQSADVLRIAPTGGGAMAPVRFEWALFRASAADEPIASSAESASGWPVERRAIGAEGGTFLLRVRSVNGVSDPVTAYAIALSVETEPDANEPNESPAAATRVTLGAPLEGVIAANADLDYYSFEVSGASTADPVVVAVTVESLQPGASVQFQFRLLETDGTTDVCGEDREACLSLRRFNDGTFTEARCHDDVLCRTAHPLRRDGTYYVLVQDFQDNQFDVDARYRVTIEELDIAAADPTERFSNDRAEALVVPLVTSMSAPTLEFAEVRGHISYVGDTDWFEFRVPTEDFTPPQNGDWELSFEFDVDGPSEIEYSARFYSPNDRSGGQLPTDPEGCPREPPTPANPDPCNFPDAGNAQNVDVGALAPDPECSVVFREDASDGRYFLRVRDAGFVAADDFDISAGSEYRFRLRMVGSCRGDGPCAENPFNQDRCPRP